MNLAACGFLDTCISPPMSTLNRHFPSRKVYPVFDHRSFLLTEANKRTNTLLDNTSTGLDDKRNCIVVVAAVDGYFASI